MGIQNFFKLIKGESITLTPYKGKTLAFDAFLELYRANFGMQKPLMYNGKITSGVNTIFSNVNKCRALNITPIYIFDTAASPLKKATIDKRKATGRPCLDAYMIDDCKKLLNYMGVSTIDVPSGYEAEQVGAHMVRKGICDALVTRDADALLFGCPTVLKKDGQKYIEYKLEDVKSQLGVNQNQLIEIGVTLGSDFAPKVSGVGPKTVVSKILNNKIKFTSEQQQAIAYFKTCPKNVTRRRHRKNEKKLIEWLVTELGFRKERVTKALNKASK